ncbi:MAG: hypothetical protein WBD31_03470 [Rubripirellula sp.]
MDLDSGASTRLPGIEKYKKHRWFPPVAQHFFADNGKAIWIICADGTAAKFDSKTYKQLKSIRWPVAAPKKATSYDLRRVIAQAFPLPGESVFVQARQWKIWDLASYTVREVPIQVAGQRLRHHVAVSNDGEMLAVCPFDFRKETLHKVTVYDLATSQQIGVIPFPDHGPHKLQFTPSDKQLALIYEDGTFDLHPVSKSFSGETHSSEKRQR